MLCQWILTVRPGRYIPLSYASGCCRFDLCVVIDALAGNSVRSLHNPHSISRPPIQLQHPRRPYGIYINIQYTRTSVDATQNFSDQLIK